MTPSYFTFHDSLNSTTSPRASLRHRASTISCTSSTSSFAPSMTSSLSPSTYPSTDCPSFKKRGPALSPLSVFSKCFTPASPLVPTTFHENILGYMLKSHELIKGGKDDDHIGQADEFVRGDGGSGGSTSQFGSSPSTLCEGEYFFGDVDQEGGIEVLKERTTRKPIQQTAIFPAHSSSHFRSHLARTKSPVFFEPEEENTNSYHPSHPRLRHRSSFSPSSSSSTASTLAENNRLPLTLGPIPHSNEQEVSSHFSSGSSSCSTHSSFSSSSTYEEIFHSLITSPTGKEFTQRKSMEKYKLRAAVKAWERSIEVGVGEMIAEAFKELKVKSSHVDL